MKHLLFLLAASLCAQTFILQAQVQVPSLSAQPGSTQDNSLAAITKPAAFYLSVASLPTTCTISSLAWVLNTTAGQNLYGCTSANTWTLETGGGGGTISFTGDGTLITNVASGTPVTVTLGTAGAHKYWGNNTGSTAAPGYDAIVAADVPTLNQNTTGQSATALALAALPTPCSSGSAPTGILANGNSTGCASIAGASGISASVNGGATVGPQTTLNVNCNTGLAGCTAAVSGSQINLGLAIDSTYINSVVAPAFAAQTDAATVTWAVASAPAANASLTFTVHGGSRTLNVTGLVAGGSYFLKLIQDATGGEGLTLGTGCVWKVSGGGSGAITPSTGANAVDVLAVTFDGTNCLSTLTKNFN